MFAGYSDIPAAPKNCEVFSLNCEFLVIIAHLKGRLDIVKGDFYFPTVHKSHCYTTQ